MFKIKGEGSRDEEKERKKEKKTGGKIAQLAKFFGGFALHSYLF